MIYFNMTCGIFQNADFYGFPHQNQIQIIPSHNLISMKFFVTLLLSFTTLASSSFTSMQCGEGKVPLSTTGFCTEILDYIQGCQIYESQSSCFKCQDSFEQTNNKLCQYLEINQQSNHLIGCLEWQTKTINNQEVKKCTNCANGFVRKNGLCNKGVKNCERYTPNNQCQECKNDYSLIMGECRHNYLLGCKKENLDHTCSQCFKPFSMEGTHCTILHCKNFNDFGCTACDCGFYLTEKRNCKEITEGCLRYSRGNCINCLPHYKLKGGACEIEGCQKYNGNHCKECNSQLYETSKNGGCIFRNCYDWHDNKCLICNEGYRRTHEGVCEEAKEMACGVSQPKQNL